MSRQGCRSTRGQLRCPRIPRAAPPTPPHTHTRGGSRPGPQAAGLGPPRRGPSTQQGFRMETGRSEPVSSNKNTPLKVCVWGKWGSGGGGWGLQDGALMPLNYIHPPPLPSQTHTVRHSPCVSAGAWWAKVVCRWLLIGPQGSGGWEGYRGIGGELLCFESCAALSSNGKGSE